MAQIVSPMELGKELVQTLREVNSQIDEVKDAAHAMGTSPYKLVDHYGNHKLAPLLTAKAQLLHGIALHNQKGK